MFDVLPLGLHIDPHASGVREVACAERVPTPSTLSAIDDAMAREDTSSLESAFSATADEQRDLPTSSDIAFPEFMIRYQRRVQHLLARYLRVPQDIDEGTQDVFLKMWLCWNCEQTHDHRHALVFRVTRHTAWDKLRSRAFREYEKTVFYEDPELLMAAAAADPSPDQLTIRAERIAAVRAALADLPAKQRELVIARWYAETSFADLAATRGTTTRALITQQTRIFKRLRLQLAREEA